jgi:hypothetical protein
MSDEPAHPSTAFRRLFLAKDDNTPRVARVSAPMSRDRAGPYARKAFADELATLARTRQGRRNAQLNVSAFNLSQLVGAGLLDHGETWAALHDVALSIGLTESETNGTLASGFEAGTRQPRVVSQLDSEEPPPVTILSFPDEDDPEHSAVEALFPRIDWHKLWADETTEEWIVEPLIPARRLVALFSAPKVGTSLLMLELAAAIARGASVLGQPPQPPRRVLYVDFENDPRGDIRTRLKNMGLTPDDLDNLVYLSFPQLAYLDTPMGGLQLHEAAKHYGCEVVVIDTISRAVGGEENANDTWLGFYKNTGLLLKASGIAVVRLDHTGKDESKGMRGGSAKYGDVDAVWAMKRVTETTYQLECTANRLPITEKLLVIHREEEPHLHHRVDGRGVFGMLNALDEERIAVLDKAFGTEPVPSERRAIDVLRLAPVPSGARTLSMRHELPLKRLLDERERRHGRQGKHVSEHEE